MQSQAAGKKGKLDKDKAVIFAVVAVAAAITVAALVVAKGVWGQATYLGKVADKKDTALRQLKDNKAALGSLEEAYKKFDEQDPNLLGGRPNGTGEQDGSNSTLILDALPNKYDFPALAASLDKLLQGYRINDITGQDDALTYFGGTAPDGVLVEMPFSFSVNTNYDGFKELIGKFGRSIRPFQLTKIDLSGLNSDLKVVVEAKTFYQPERGLQITEEVVQ